MIDIDVFGLASMSGLFRDHVSSGPASEPFNVDVRGEIFFQ